MKFTGIQTVYFFSFPHTWNVSAAKVLYQQPIAIPAYGPS